MCGIVGIYTKANTPSVSTIRDMNKAIFKRGPDDEGFYESGPLSLGMRRLSIIDVDNGKQPMYSGDGSVVVVFNGEIYNHNELRSELVNDGYEFKTKSDTEVIANLYHSKGIEFLNHLRGMFGLCIWDIKKQKGYLCRDQLGIKPIFTSVTDSGDFLFASEIKAILASGMVGTAIDLQGLDAYLAYNYIPSPLTIYKSIKKLPPAHYIEFSNKSINSPKKYWDVNSCLNGKKYNLDQIEEAIHDSIEHHMESDVPIGSFLSGGIDSSLVTALASKNKQFKSAYTIGFGSGSHLYDERPLAEMVSNRYGIKDHRKVEVQPNPEEAINGAVAAFDEPFADDSIIPTWEICKIASKDLKVCLTGLGGDELFGGYYRYLGITLYEKYSIVPKFIRKIILNTAKTCIRAKSSRKVDHIIRFLEASVLDENEVYASFITALNKSNRKELYSENIKNKIDFHGTENIMKDHFNEAMGESLLSKAIYTDIKAYVPDDILALSDRISMSHSLELRVPLMDRILLSKCYPIPDNLKVSLKEKKILLRKIAKKYLPKNLFEAKKQGFESPMAYWINNDLMNYIDQKLSSKMLERQGIFNPNSVKEILSNHRSGKSDNSKIIFSILIFQLWMEHGSVHA